MSDYRREYEVDVLVRGHGNLDLTRQCLNSLLRNTDQSRIHITYVDNGSDRAELLELIKVYHEQCIQFVALPFNHGSVRAINVGLSLASLSSAPYVLLLDNDTEIPQDDKDWLDRWLTYFEDEHVGAAGAVSDYVSGYQNCEANPDLYQKEWEIEGEGRGFKEPPRLPCLVSFALMLRKSAVFEVGMFDEQFEPKNWEDYDYTVRMMDAGYKNVIANSVWVHHRGQNKDTAMQEESLVLNQAKFIQKYGVEGLAQRGLRIG